MSGGGSEASVSRETLPRPAMDLAARACTDVLEHLAAGFREPAFRAGFGAALLSAAMFARAGSRPAAAIVISVMIGAAVEHLYGMAEDIHAAAITKLGSDAAGPVHPR